MEGAYLLKRKKENYTHDRKPSLMTADNVTRGKRPFAPSHAPRSPRNTLSLSPRTFSRPAATRLEVLLDECVAARSPGVSAGVSVVCSLGYCMPLWNAISTDATRSISFPFEQSAES